MAKCELCGIKTEWITKNQGNHKDYSDKHKITYASSSPTGSRAGVAGSASTNDRMN